MLKKERKTPFTTVKLGRWNVTWNVYALLLPLCAVQIEGILTSVVIPGRYLRTDVCLLHVRLPETLLFLGNSISRWSQQRDQGEVWVPPVSQCNDVQRFPLYTNPFRLAERLNTFHLGDFSQTVASVWILFFVEKLPPAAGGRCCKSDPLPDRNLLNIISCNEISYNEIIISL